MTATTSPARNYRDHLYSQFLAGKISYDQLLTSTKNLSVPR